jgi:hypothetical protein
VSMSNARATVSDLQLQHPDKPEREPDPRPDRGRDEDTPETPPTEPPPMPVQDPPAEPEPGGPYVVSAPRRPYKEESSGRST